MKIAITGARGGVGKEIVKLCSDCGHETVQVNRTDQKHNGTPNSEMRTADVASDYNATVKAFTGCDAVIHLAAIANPVDKDHWKVHNNNVDAAFNGFHAAATLGIKKVCYASSVNAIGLAFSNQPLRFDYFPIDEEAPQRPTDPYALAKDEAEYQAQCFVNWFPGMKIACMRIHEVAGLKNVQKDHQENWNDSAVKQLWGWVHPQAVARACLLAVEKAESLKGCEIFNIVAPTTTQELSSKGLANKYFPQAEIKGDFSKNQAFWSTAKAQRLLGWLHHEME
ncbi:hypothetical protein BGW36DRAFT_307077 [Talaromyces proteolyticus]|uniref:NAD-dependent epimerase/dehydratase domain-containing protein n=1 Tax=Talaromyces proteolyticus TaxID=1131652 RepID=A0AAD4PT44_9EURO|nr:uncharacterized protein BGW36DRAFT_307077 [Talaromyces proteolyticus]KAH8690159.1 hypothetical protein BGW36DRAFT_307077 [Talaromyces proteolyticus]